MKHYHSLAQAQPLFKALSAPMRVRIMELLYENENIPLTALAEKLALTNSAITLHTKILSEAGLIDITSVPGKRGMMKICRPTCSSLLISMNPSRESRYCYEDDIPIGSYSRIEAAPTCGLATTEHIIGEFDNPRYFSYPDRLKAGVFWFATGFAEYVLPNHLKPGEILTELELSMELSSESPDYNDDYPSDIEFYINDIYLGQWISPGDFGEKKGLLTPEWWPRLCNQYGLLKTLSIKTDGVYIDNGHKISDVTISDLGLSYSTPLIFRLQVRPDAVNCGGMTLFGKGFGNYNQNIVMKTYYEKK